MRDGRSLLVRGANVGSENMKHSLILRAKLSVGLGFQTLATMTIVCKASGHNIIQGLL